MEGIKEIKEFQLALINLVKVAKIIAADGKIGVDDLATLISELKSVNIYIDAIRGIKKIPSEIKDIDSEELAQLASMVFELVNEIRK